MRFHIPPKYFGPSTAKFARLILANHLVSTTVVRNSIWILRPPFVGLPTHRRTHLNLLMKYINIRKTFRQLHLTSGYKRNHVPLALVGTGTPYLLGTLSFADNISLGDINGTHSSARGNRYLILRTLVPYLSPKPHIDRMFGMLPRDIERVGARNLNHILEKSL